MKLRRVISLLLMTSFAAGLLTSPQDAASAAREGLTLCLETVIPSLFPFFVLSSLLIYCGAAEELGKMLYPLLYRAYHIGGGGGAALALGLVGGYPVGARTVAELYEKKMLTKTEAERLLAFCNNAGPGFVLGICGGVVFHSGRIGIYLYLTHAASALLTGLIVCRSLPAPQYLPYHRKTAASSLFTVLPTAVTGALTSVLNVSAFVVLFKIILQLLLSCIPLSGLGHTILLGIIEMTSGVTSLSPTRGGFAACAAFLSWGGLSVHCQTLSVLSNVKIDVKSYLFGKIIQTLITLPLAWVVSYRLF